MTHCFNWLFFITQYLLLWQLRKLTIRLSRPILSVLAATKNDRPECQAETQEVEQI